MHCFYYATPHGSVTIGASAEGIELVAFGEIALDETPRPTELTNKAATQIQEYFSGKRFAFDVPVHLSGSGFQNEVWRRVMKIPYGSTATAADIARAIGRPSGQRSVGSALSKNKIALLVPDHRVVSAAGKPWGQGVPARIRGGLLQMEKRNLE